MSAIIENNKILLVNPISKKSIGKIDICDKNSFSIIEEKASAYNEWSKLSLKKRCNIINEFRKIILKNKDQIQKILIEETGKKKFDAFTELFTTLEHLKEITKIAKKSLRNSIRNTGLLKNKKAYVQYEPLGVIGIISPWNYPLVTPITTISEALIAGNNVILKPSEHTPLIIKFLKDLWDKGIGYKKAFQVIYGPGNVGQMLVESKKNHLICFTGSTAVGKKIAQECAKTLKPVILELGGKDSMIVLKDANQRRAIESALFGGLSNAGQACISIEQIYVEENIFDEFTNEISNRVENMSAGDNTNDSIGCIITPENYDKINSQLAELNSSIKVIKGKKRSDNCYIPPTLVINPPSDSRIVNEETFGPIILLNSFNDDNKLLEKIHQTGYGLSGSIFGKDKKRVKQITKKVKTGNMSINDVFSHYGIASLPFGGEGISGLGKIHGKEGLRSFCRTKSIVESKYHFIDDPWWFNRTKKMEKILKSAISFIYKW